MCWVGDEWACVWSEMGWRVLGRRWVGVCGVVGGWMCVG